MSEPNPHDPLVLPIANVFLRDHQACVRACVRAGGRDEGVTVVYRQVHRHRGRVDAALRLGARARIRAEQRHLSGD